MAGSTNLSRRRVLFALGGMSAAALLAACSSSAAPTAAPAAATPVPSSAVKPTQAPPTVAGAPATAAQPSAAATAPPAQGAAGARPEVGLEIWFENANTPQKEIDVVLAGFEAANPGVKFAQRVGTPGNDYLTKVLTSVAGGTQADVMYSHPAMVGAMAAKDVLTPLDDLLKQNNFPIDDFFASGIAYLKWRGKQWALPYQPQHSFYIYNTDMVKAANAEDPRKLFLANQWTTEKYAELMAAISKGDGPDRVYGAAGTGGALQIWDVWVWGFGGEIFSPDYTRATFDSPEALKAWTYLTDQHLKAYTPKVSVSKMLQDQFTLVNGGKAAFLFYVRSFNFTMSPQIKWSTVPAPVMPALGKSITRGASNGFGIGSKTKYKGEALKAVQWWALQGNQHFMEVGSADAARKSQAEAFKKTMLPWESYEVWQVAAETDRVLELPSNLADLNRAAATAFDNVVLNGKDVASEFKAAAAAATAALQKANG